MSETAGKKINKGKCKKRQTETQNIKKNNIKY